MIDKPTEPGIYRDPKNGDLWHRSEHGWRWMNGNRWSFVPDGLERVDDAFGQAPAVGSQSEEP